LRHALENGRELINSLRGTERLGLIIGPTTHPEAGKNICGPCCIEVPDWVAGRLGAYYLYFADHEGDCIKMAYADHLTGPWQMVPGGVLTLDGFLDAYDHIASPDIHIDNLKGLIRLYFHARAHSLGRQQWSFSAISHDGLSFKPEVDYPLAPFYLRVFAYQDSIFGITKGGNLWRSPDGIRPFEKGGNIFSPGLAKDLWHNFPGAARHFGLCLKGDYLEVFFSRIGDAPERILRSVVELKRNDWFEWQCGEISEIIRPAEPFEGAALSLSSSASGPSSEGENALRDPDVLSTKNGDYLFYSVAGEKGIALAKFV